MARLNNELAQEKDAAHAALMVALRFSKTMKGKRTGLVQGSLNENIAAAALAYGEKYEAWLEDTKPPAE